MILPSGLLYTVFCFFSFKYLRTLTVSLGAGAYETVLVLIFFLLFYSIMIYFIKGPVILLSELYKLGLICLCSFVCLHVSLIFYIAIQMGYEPLILDLGWLKLYKMYWEDSELVKMCVGELRGMNKLHLNIDISKIVVASDHDIFKCRKLLLSEIETQETNTIFKFLLSTFPNSEWLLNLGLSFGGLVVYTVAGIVLNRFVTFIANNYIFFRVESLAQTVQDLKEDVEKNQNIAEKAISDVMEDHSRMDVVVPQIKKNEQIIQTLEDAIRKIGKDSVLNHEITLNIAESILTVMHGNASVEDQKLIAAVLKMITEERGPRMKIAQGSARLVPSTGRGDRLGEE